MNQRVLEFIEAQKKAIDEKKKAEEEIINAQKEKEKEKVLLKAGIFDKEYYDPKNSRPFTDYPCFDNEKGGIRYKPIFPQISDEEYQEILKYMPEEPKKVEAVEAVEAPEPTKPEKNNAEDCLNVVAIVILIAGIITFLVYFVIALDDYEFNWAEFFVGVLYLFVSFATYSIMKVLRNISLKLNKLK